MIPLLITIIIASLDIQNIATRVSTKLSKHELNTAVYSIENLLDYMGTEIFLTQTVIYTKAQQT